MWRLSLRRIVIVGFSILALAYLFQLLSFASFSNSSNAQDARQNAAAKRQLGNPPQWFFDKTSSPLTAASDDQLRSLAGLSNKERFLGLLQPILIPRVSGTQGNLQVQQFLITTLQNLGYTIELDKFDDSPPAPHARRTFTNIIATLDPNAPRRLVLVCHYDSKFDSRGEFVGATDSAVPCAMLLDLATALRGRVDNRSTKQDITLQLLFMDGEEAFGEWSATDSLYGARHLANSWSRTRNRFAPDVASMNELSSMDVFVLLDLIGTTDTNFRNFFSSTGDLYNQLSKDEDRLAQLRLIKQWGRLDNYFDRGGFPVGMIDDDHRPFMEKGVKIVHLISYPFPSVWHKYEDNIANIHYDTVDDINKILRVFVCEYLSCRF
ncbi:glutaminyl-peptide cyclotransferase-like [Paramacrobiotus metropolitanus]|uniref:glutaminyl-peptide cyclotransferase-like n=1 Tax=Paramacrobiotus metropolitanus TaxID=2943436 RepID=UPI002445E5E4|nr:glutaminyl-peptide cyclotransferase-like [Paramacrobiotus metropolitanus]